MVSGRDAAASGREAQSLPLLQAEGGAVYGFRLTLRRAQGCLVRMVRAPAMRRVRGLIIKDVPPAKTSGRLDPSRAPAGPRRRATFLEDLARARRPVACPGLPTHIDSWTSRPDRMTKFPVFGSPVWHSEKVWG